MLFVPRDSHRTPNLSFSRTSFMVSVLMIFISISIQTIFGFTFITDEDEDTIKQNGKPSYNLALSGRRDVFTLRDFNLSALHSVLPFLSPTTYHRLKGA